MLNWFFKRPQKPVAIPKRKPRGILPFTDGGRVTIRKMAPNIKNTYEVRLGLFMAVQHAHQPFVLAVPHGALVAEDLRATITEIGGSIVEQSSDEFSVYIGAESSDGSELDGWVLGDQTALVQLSAAFGPEWPGPALTPGSHFVDEELVALQSAVRLAPLQLCNVDDEDVRTALLALIESARASGGRVYVQ
jgi:hypothetical protein